MTLTRSPILDRDEISTFLDIHVPINIGQVYDYDTLKPSKPKALELSSNPEPSSSIAQQLTTISRKLTLADIQSLIPERKPGLRIERAVICEAEDNDLILAPLTITEEMCAGHMPGFPILPLAEAGRTLAQLGAVLIGFIVKEIEKRDGLFTPLVYKVGEIISGQQGFLFPNDQICLIAKGRKLKGPLYLVQAHGYLGDKHIFSMPKIHYFLSQDVRLWQMESSYVNRN